MMVQPWGRHGCCLMNIFIKVGCEWGFYRSVTDTPMGMFHTKFKNCFLGSCRKNVRTTHHKGKHTNTIEKFNIIQN